MGFCPHRAGAGDFERRFAAEQRLRRLRRDLSGFGSTWPLGIPPLPGARRPVLVVLPDGRIVILT